VEYTGASVARGEGGAMAPWQKGERKDKEGGTLGLKKGCGGEEEGDPEAKLGYRALAPQKRRVQACAVLKDKGPVKARVLINRMQSENVG